MRRGKARFCTAVVLAAVLVLSMMPAAFAAGEGDGTDALTIEIKEVGGQTIVTGLELDGETGVAPSVGELELALAAHAAKIEVKTSDGGETSSDDTCATGMQIVLDDKEPAALSVLGDVLGTGKMSLTQMTRMASAFEGKNPLEGAYLAAGDFTGSGSIGLTDLVRESQLYLSVQQGEKPGPSETPVVGGWNIPDSPVLTDDLKTAFENADGLPDDAQFTPIACVGQQVVAGTNYRILCTEKSDDPEAEAYYDLVTLYVKLDGSSEITNMLYSDGTQPPFANTAGGWAEPQTPVVTEEAAAAVKAADDSYTPVALLGTQVVAGMNYLVCSEKDGEYAVQTVYAKLDQTAEITETFPFTQGSEPGPSPSPSGEPSEEPSPSASASPSTSPSGEPDAGDWKIPSSPVLDAKLTEAFEKAEGLTETSKYTPVACVGQKDGEDTYFILCTEVMEGEEDEWYDLAELNIKEDGTSEVTRFFLSDGTQPNFSEGGWTKPETPEIPDEVREVLQTVEGAYYPIALLGTSAEDGTTYCICSVSGEEFAIQNVKVNKDGTSEVLETLPFTFSEDEPEPGPSASTSAGPWEKPASPVITDEVKKAFDTAIEKETSVTYDAVGLLAQQSADGMNYRILCTSKRNSSDAPATYAILTINVEADGSAEIIRTMTSRDPALVYGTGDGEWTKPETPDVPKAVADIVTSTNQEFVPLVYLGSQEAEEGLNYCVCCDTPQGFNVVTVYHGYGSGGDEQE